MDDQSTAHIAITPELSAGALSGVAGRGESMGSSQLRRRLGFKLYPAFASAVTVFVFWFPIATLFGRAKCAPAGLLVWTWLALVGYNVMPSEMSARLHRLLILYVIAAILYSLLASDRIFVSLGLSVLFAIGIGLIAMLEVARVSYINFHQLPEIIPFKPSSGPAAAKPLFSFVTDIHITHSDFVTRAEGGPGGQSNLTKWLQRESENPPDYLLIGGDQTDTGSKAEWEKFTEITKSYLDRQSCLLFAPGNHDMYSAYHGYSGNESHDRLWLYLKALAACVPSMKTARGDTLKEIASTKPRDLETAIQKLGKNPFEFDIAEEGVTESADLLEWRREDARLRLFSHWFDYNKDNFFPLQLVDSAREVVILILNSCPDYLRGRKMAPGPLGDSALGRLGRGQLDRLNQVLMTLPESCKNVLILVHHPPYRRPGEWKWKLTGKAIQDSAFLAHDAIEARDFLTILVEQAHQHAEMNFVLCCGHRHTPVVAYAGRVLVLEGASLAEEDASVWRGTVDYHRIRVANC